MRSEVRASPEAEHTVWWMLLCRAVEQRVRDALAARAGAERPSVFMQAHVLGFNSFHPPAAPPAPSHEATRAALEALDWCATLTDGTPRHGEVERAIALLRAALGGGE